MVFVRNVPRWQHSACCQSLLQSLPQHQNTRTCIFTSVTVDVDSVRWSERLNPMVLELLTENAPAYFSCRDVWERNWIVALISTGCSKTPAFPSPSKSGLTQQYYLNNNPVWNRWIYLIRKRKRWEEENGNKKPKPTTKVNIQNFPLR